MNRRDFSLLLPLASCSLAACAAPRRARSPSSMVDSRDAGAGVLFEKIERRGTFVLFDEQAGVLTIAGEDPDRAHIPASTFKIPNSLIALETGVIEDEATTLKWDGVIRSITIGAEQIAMPEWNRDHDMRSAMKVSCVWFYQELARRIGETRMKDKLLAYGYGNHSIEGGIDRFWLDGGIRITPRQQVSFLQKLWRDELPASGTNQASVRRLLVLEERDGRTLYGKTGMADTAGWFVGTVTKPGKRWFFALVLNDFDDRPTMKLRRPLAEALLARYGV